MSLDLAPLDGKISARHRVASSTATTLAGVFCSLALGALALGCGGETDDRPVQWSYISTVVVQPSCATANCHSALTARSTVDLSEIRVGWAKLISGHFVIPQCSAKSAMVHLLRGQGSRRMPPTFALANADIALIERWIDSGAAYDGPGGGPPVTPDVTGCTSTTPADGGAEAGI